MDDRSLFPCLICFKIKKKEKMELISKKTKEIILRRSNENDLNKIFEFHQKKMQPNKPKYLQNALESAVGISIVAYKEAALLGHILVVPLSSQSNIGIEEASIICGIWTNEANVAELLVREAMMCSWEAGFHALFCFENYPDLTKIGFQPADKRNFAFNLDKYDVMGIELSWDGFEIISKDLVLPKAYLPSIQQLNHFSNN